MRAEHVKCLACPDCRSTLDLTHQCIDDEADIVTGELRCTRCQKNYPILRHVPRFVALENYTSNFGLEWNKHSRTQYDSYTGTNISETRFAMETRWPSDLRGQILLEAGSGSGRFTEQAVKTGALVISLDLSEAVDANWASNGRRANVLICQADICKMPLAYESCDKVMCFGVLQHTPDPRRTFTQLLHHLRPGGEVAADVYRRYPAGLQMLNTRYWVRPLTRRISASLLYRVVDRYVRLMWPLCRIINKVPYGRRINVALLIADYRGVYDLSDDILKEWAILDSFDYLSPFYDQPQPVEAFELWFREAGLTNIDVKPGFGGIEGRGRKALPAQQA